MTTTVAPICFECLHFRRSDEHGKLVCEAFPFGIPKEILLSQRDHRQSMLGDRGLVFEPEDPSHVGERTQNPLLLGIT